MEEFGSSSSRGRKAYTRTRAKLAESSEARHGEVGFFSSTRRKKRSTRIEVSTDSSSDDPGRRVVLVDLISSGDNSDNNSGDDSEDHEASSKAIMQDLSLYLHIFTDQLFQCINFHLL
jgi:hypothetical protein